MQSRLQPWADRSRVRGWLFEVFVFGLKGAGGAGQDRGLAPARDPEFRSRHPGAPTRQRRCGVRPSGDGGAYQSADSLKGSQWLYQRRS